MASSRARMGDFESICAKNADDCPSCGVWRGHPCRTPSGATRTPHKARLDAYRAEVQRIASLRAPSASPEATPPTTARCAICNDKWTQAWHEKYGPCPPVVAPDTDGRAQQP